VPSPGAQDQFARAFLARAAQEKYDYNFVEAYDQPWKSKSAEGPAGASWGLFDGQRAAKIPLVAG
jgi:exo-beta-1,3-glucanase (GH17 family)